MTLTARTKLLPLEDTHLTVKEPTEDIRSRNMIDRDGEEVGKVDDLLIDEEEHRVRFIRVASGGFLGLGKSRALIPVEAITNITEDEVHIDQSRDRIAGAPEYDPELIDERYYESLYGYYGYRPFWGAGYRYPPFPRYPSHWRS